MWSFADPPDSLRRAVEATGAQLVVSPRDAQAELIRVHRLAVELALREKRDRTHRRTSAGRSPTRRSDAAVPVPQVFADLDDPAAALEGLCHDVADTLHLAPSDVVATHVPAGSCVVPGNPNPQWPVVIMHGTRRDPDVMHAARTRVASRVRSWPGVDDVWVTWLVSC